MAGGGLRGELRLPRWSCRGWGQTARVHECRGTEKRERSRKPASRRAASNTRTSGKLTEEPAERRAFVVLLLPRHSCRGSGAGGPERRPRARGPGWSPEGPTHPHARRPPSPSTRARAPAIRVALPFIPATPRRVPMPVRADHPAPRRGRIHPPSPSPFRSSRRHYPATGTCPPCISTALPLDADTPALHPHRRSVDPEGPTPDGYPSPSLPTALPLDADASTLDSDRLPVHPEGTTRRWVAAPRPCRPRFPSTRTHPPSIPIAFPCIPKALPPDGYPSPVHADRPSPRRGRIHPPSPSPLHSSRRHCPPDGYPSPVHADRPSPRRGRTHPPSPSPFRASRRHCPPKGTRPPFMPTALPLDADAPTLHPHRLSVHPEGTTPRRVPVPRSCRPPFPSTRTHPPSIPIALASIPGASPFRGSPVPVQGYRSSVDGDTPHPAREPGPVEGNPATHGSPPGSPGPEGLPRLARHRSPSIPIAPGASRPRPPSTSLPFARAGAGLHARLLEPACTRAPSASSEGGSPSIPSAAAVTVAAVGQGLVLAPRRIGTRNHIVRSKIAWFPLTLVRGNEAPSEKSTGPAVDFA